MRYCVDYAARGTAGCKRCKQKIDKGCLRIGKIVPNSFSDSGGDMKLWHHMECLFELMQNPRANKLTSTDEIEGFDEIKQDDKDAIQKNIKKLKGKKEKTKGVGKPLKVPLASTSGYNASSSVATADDQFRHFRKLCFEIYKEPSYNEKIRVFKNFFKNGPNGNGFKGDLHLWIKMLLPHVEPRVYNLQNKQLIKLFSTIFRLESEELSDAMNECGDISEVIATFFEKSKGPLPAKESTATLQEVDNFLGKLENLSREDEQIAEIKKVISKFTSKDLKFIVRLIKHDLRINAGPKHVLSGLHDEAYEAFQASRDLRSIVSKVKSGGDDLISTMIMTPILPMLAEPCRSLDAPFKKFKSTIYCETKYDGERVQIHKKGENFKYFSRSLKPVQEHKIESLGAYIKQAIPDGNDLVLDSEVVLFDHNTKKPLPFGTLGKHKKEEFKDASVCLFLFDCIHLNGQNLINNSFIERRAVLEENVKPINGRVMLSKIHRVKDKNHLKTLMEDAIHQKLEGLLLKDADGIYEPGKRHWMKMKKDYLNEGSMADSADLVVLGAYYGTGSKGGMMSIFLMGCYDEDRDTWLTVCKVGNGHDDVTLDRLQVELKNLMKPTKRESDAIPIRIRINRSLMPDFVIRNPKEAPVWEITGAEFSKSSAHTANGISIRFPRVTKIRRDKSWKEATSLSELTSLFQKSSETWHISDENNAHGGESVRKRERSSSPSTSCSSSSKEVSPEAKKQKVSDSDKSFSLSEEKVPCPVDDGKAHLMVSKKLFHGVEEGFSNFSCLPSIFFNLNVCIRPCIQDHALLQRYIIAYKGSVVHEDEIQEATHVIITEEEDEIAIRAAIAAKSGLKNSHQIVTVTANWFWHSIKLQKLLPCDKYSYFKSPYVVEPY